LDTVQSGNIQVVYNVFFSSAALILGRSVNEVGDAW